MKKYYIAAFFLCSASAFAADNHDIPSGATIVKLDKIESLGEWNHYAYEYEYDAKGNRTCESYFYESKDTPWQVTEKNVYDYDDNGNVTLHEHYSFFNDKLNPYEKHEYTYNSDNQKIAEVFSQGYDNQWHPSSKREFAYDAQGNLVETIVILCRDGKWTNDMKSVYTFDEHNNQISGVFYLWQNDEWVFFDYEDKHEYTYDAEGRPTSVVRYKWYDEWQEIDKEVYSYDDRGDLIELTGYTYFYESWNESYKGVYAYDDQHRQISYIDYQYSDDAWKGRYKYEHEYDEKGNLTRYEEYRWDKDYRDWLSMIREVYTYDLSVYAVDGGNKVTSRYHYDYERPYEIKYYYSTFDTSNIEQQTLTPAAPTYYDLLGRRTKAPADGRILLRKDASGKVKKVM